MKKAKGLHEGQADELKKTADASADVYAEGEIRDEDAQGVAGGAPFFGEESSKQAPVTPV